MLETDRISADYCALGMGLGNEFPSIHLESMNAQEGSLIKGDSSWVDGIAE
jgi:hypothetical protein